jgi:GNAT superfamily N-acetyltransferase
MRTPDLDLATHGDADWVCDLIAKAFQPLEPCAWLVPDPAERAQILPEYFRIFVDHALDHGTVHIVADRSAAAVWLPAGTDGPSEPDSYRDRLADAVGAHLERFELFDEQLEKAHLTGQHHHLWLLAAHPDRQHAGLGSALLTAYHERLDLEGIPAYLEASDTGTRQLYLRHGYQDHSHPIELPSGPLMYPMVRPAPHPQKSRQSVASGEAGR